jgi:AcrR family transcriptional regulator
MENQRIRLSKKMLKDSLIRLLKEKDIQKITVHEICNGAQINRTTFYKYYGSQYALLDDIESDIFCELESYLTGQKAQQILTEDDGLAQTLAYLEREEKYHRLFNATTDKEFAEKLFDLTFIHDMVRENTPKQYTGDEARYLHTFIKHGGYAMIREWLNKENRETPQEMSALMRTMLSRLVRE